MMGKRISVLVLVSVVLLCAAPVVAQQTVPQVRDPGTKVEEKETVIPSPKDIKERTAIYVFVGWMWLAIVVLIFILKAKIREVDRLHRIKFFSRQKE